MQAMIAEKMQNLQNAISKREPRKRDENNNASTLDQSSFRIKKTQLTSLMQFEGKYNKNHENSQWIKVRPDSYSNLKVSSRNKSDQKWPLNRNISSLVSGTPSFISDNRWKSVNKKRRTRREREASIENSSTNDKKQSILKVKQDNSDYIIFNENVKLPNYMKINDRNSRTTLWSVERSNHNESFMSQINAKAINIDKNAHLITKKTFEAISKIRPTQSTIRCIRFLVLTLRYFNKNLTNISEYGGWSILLSSVLSNSSTIWKEIKHISKRWLSINSAPLLIEEMNTQLFINKDKNVPSCSKAFQKECKPIANLLQSIVSYFETKDKSVDGRSDTSAHFQTNDQSCQILRNNESHQLQTLNNFDFDQPEISKTR